MYVQWQINNYVKCKGCNEIVGMLSNWQGQQHCPKCGYLEIEYLNSNKEFHQEHPQDN